MFLVSDELSKTYSNASLTGLEAVSDSSPLYSFFFFFCTILIWKIKFSAFSYLIKMWTAFSFIEWND